MPELFLMYISQLQCISRTVFADLGSGPHKTEQDKKESRVRGMAFPAPLPAQDPQPEVQNSEFHEDWDRDPKYCFNVNKI